MNKLALAISLVLFSTVSLADSADGTTELMNAVTKRNYVEISKQIKSGADVNATNRYGGRAILMAANNGDTEAVKLLLAAGADPNSSTAEGGTVLMAAARTGEIEMIKMLLEKGADINAAESWKGQTALMFAAVEDHPEVVELLVSKGANINAVSAEITVPEPNPDRRAGGFVYPKIPKGRMTALHLAAREGSINAVKALVKNGADLNIGDGEGTPAVVLATLNGHPNTAIELLNAGADPNVADKYGRTVLFVATDMNTLDATPRPAPPIVDDHSFVDVVKLAIAKGADVNATLKTGLPQWVAQGGGHNPYLREGATAFFRASMSADLPIMNILLAAGADPLKATAPGGKAFGGGKTGKTTPLQAAAGVPWREEISRGRVSDAIEAMKILLAKGAKINEANENGDTALIGAALRGKPELVEFLLNNGADINAKNEKGQTAALIAAGMSDFRILPNPAVAEVLAKHKKPVTAILGKN